MHATLHEHCTGKPGPLSLVPKGKGGGSKIELFKRSRRRGSPPDRSISDLGPCVRNRGGIRGVSGIF